MVAISIEMPKSCNECFLKGYDECLWLGKYTPDDGKRLNDCPLVEIVTCKDCKHRRGNVCRSFRHLISDDFFCGDAERKESK